jgi:hypothetical protein
MGKQIDLSAVLGDDRPGVRVVPEGPYHRVATPNAIVLRKLQELEAMPESGAKTLGYYAVAQELLPTADPAEIDRLEIPRIVEIMEIAVDPVRAAERYLRRQDEARHHPNGAGGESSRHSSPTTGSDTSAGKSPAPPEPPSPTFSGNP